MLKQEIINHLNNLHTEINQFVNHSDYKDFNQSRENGKWSKADEIGHLINTLQETNKGLTFPKFFLKYKFGVCNRAERTYDEVVKKYHDKLANTSISNNPFQVKNIATFSKEKIVRDYQLEQKKFEKKFNKFNEEQLSKLLLPHPLLGKLTIREFAYFIHYHSQHHFDNIKNKD